MTNEERIPTFEEWFFNQDPTDELKAAYFIAKQQAKEEEEILQSEYKLWEEITNQINKHRNKTIKDILNSISCPVYGGDWTTIGSR